MRTLSDKVLLRFMQDGPTLEQLTRRISQEFSEEVPSRSVGEALLALQDKDFVFLDNGRWWRTTEGVIFTERTPEEKSQGENFEKTDRKRLGVSSRRSRDGKRDLILAAIIALLTLVLKLRCSFSYVIPGWDPTVYLLNARRFLYGYDQFSYFELLRPPLLPWLVALTWNVFGESYLAAAFIQPIFTVLAGLVLYLLIRKMFDWKTAMISFLVFLFNQELFETTNEVLTHGVELFFAMLCIFCAWIAHSETVSTDNYRQYAYAIVIGFLAALSSLTRYPAILFFPAVLVLVLKRDIKWDVKWITICGLSFVATWIPWLRWNMINAFGDPFASVKAGFMTVAYLEQNSPWYLYLTSLPELVSWVGVVLFLLGLASRETLKDRKIFIFFCWFAIGTIVFSAFPLRGLRFAIDWFPPIAVLISLGVRRIWRLLSFRPRVLFNLLLASWLIYLVINTNFQAFVSVENTNNSAVKELPTVASWITVNMRKDAIGASDLFSPQLNYFSRRFLYSFDYLDSQVQERKMTLRDVFIKLNVTFVVVTSPYAQVRGLSKFDYLVMLKNFSNFVAYTVVNEVGVKYQKAVFIGQQAVTQTIMFHIPDVCYIFCQSFGGMMNVSSLSGATTLGPWRIARVCEEDGYPPGTPLELTSIERTAA